VRAFATNPGQPILAAATAGLMLVFAWAAVMTPQGLVLGASLVLGWSLFTLALIDLTVFRLPDALTLPLIALGLGLSVLLPGRPILDHLAGAAAGWGALAALAFVYERLRGREGVGLGDAKLLGAAGAWLGWRPLPSVILLACAAAFVWVGFQAMRRGRTALGDRIAFGAPLCLAFWVVWLHGPLAA
jgi:leader peptidase (prepilin peptidase)/N-methyltransferase